MSVQINQGWIIVDCDAPDQATVEISLDGPSAEAFAPAFRDYDGKKRIAKVRVPAFAGRMAVYLRVDGHAQLVGRVVA